MSVRQQIIDAMNTRFSLIKKTSGYHSDIGNNIQEWYTETTPDDLLAGLLPMMNIKDGNSEISIEVMGLFSHELAVDLEIYTTKGKTTADEMRLILEDVFTAIGTDDTWGGLAQYTIFGDNEVGKRSINLVVEQYAKTIARVIISMKVLYRTNYWQI